MPTLYIIAGCNGAGKTTASMTLLPEILNCKEFVNADSIAAGISPFNPETVAFASARLMLFRIHELIKAKHTFAFETTLSTKSYRNVIVHAKTLGYEVILIFFWLNSTELAIKRIAYRVKNGGHNVPSMIVKRRYSRGLSNFFSIFSPLVDSWMVFDNSGKKPILIAEKKSSVESIYNTKIWNKIQETQK